VKLVARRVDLGNRPSTRSSTYFVAAPRRTASGLLIQVGKGLLRSGWNRLSDRRVVQRRRPQLRAQQPCTAHRGPRAEAPLRVHLDLDVLVSSTRRRRDRLKPTRGPLPDYVELPAAQHLRRQDFGGYTEHRPKSAADAPRILPRLASRVRALPARTTRCPASSVSRRTDCRSTWDWVVDSIQPTIESTNPAKRTSSASADSNNCRSSVVPPAGFEPALPRPEAGRSRDR
jgi:hypothetical protein